MRVINNQDGIVFSDNLIYLVQRSYFARQGKDTIGNYQRTRSPVIIEQVIEMTGVTMIIVDHPDHIGRDGSNNAGMGRLVDKDR